MNRYLYYQQQVFLAWLKRGWWAAKRWLNFS
jgi:hypothetical protein